MAKTIWIIIAIATLGIGAVAYFIHNRYMRKKNYCPTCHSQLVFSKEPFEKPKLVEHLTAKEKVIAKVEKKSQAKKTSKAKSKPSKKKKEGIKPEEKLICPFCGELLDEKYATCPYCQEPLKL